jgi:hypothetical protein
VKREGDGDRLRTHHLTAVTAHASTVLACAAEVAAFIAAGLEDGVLASFL